MTAPSSLRLLLRGFLLAAASFAASTPSCFAADFDALVEQSFHDAVAEVAPSVVQVTTIGGLDQIDEQLLAQGPTTGLIVTADGYVVSSAINFAQQPSSILVRLADGSQHPAELIGRDHNRMLVLLKIAATSPLPAVQPAPLAELRVGDWTAAVGRGLDEKQVDVSTGIVSALSRMFGRAVQADVNASPNNYGGALVDLRGRVIGVLAPMSPQPPGTGEASALAGAEYYDSGIAFAVPLERILADLPRWIEQKDLHRGLLGVGFVEGTSYATRPQIAAVWPDSPAAQAKWRKGDEIIAVDGQQVSTQTQLRFAVVPRYAGDQLKFTLRRGEGKEAQELKSEVTLAEELAAFRYAFLGVLPTRDSPTPKKSDEKQSGVVLRGVWPDSPAAKAGLRAGDQLIQIGEHSIDGVPPAIAELNARTVGEKVNVIAERPTKGGAGGEKLTLEVALAAAPEQILPRSVPPDSPSANDAEATKVEELKLAEYSQSASYYPLSSPGPAPGLLIWISDGNAESRDKLLFSWGKQLARQRVVLLVPAPADAQGWSADDLEYLAALVAAAKGQLHGDPLRIAVGGESKAGQLAYLLAFKAKRLLRGACVVDAPLPRTLELPANVPGERLNVLSIETQNASLTLLIAQDVAKLRDAGYPVAQWRRKADNPGETRLDDASRDTIARWLDGLDGF